MRPGRRSHRQRLGSGLTLLELILVVAILGVLATISGPAVWKQAAKTKRTEAITGLTAIHRHQIAHQIETGLYGDTFDELGFELDGGTRIDERTLQGRHYTFSVTALPLAGRPRANFQAVATGDIDPFDPTLDILLIENALTVVE